MKMNFFIFNNKKVKFLEKLSKKIFILNEISIKQFFFLLVIYISVAISHEIFLKKNLDNNIIKIVIPFFYTPKTIINKISCDYSGSNNNFFIKIENYILEINFLNKNHIFIDDLCKKKFESFLNKVTNEYSQINYNNHKYELEKFSKERLIHIILSKKEFFFNKNYIYYFGQELNKENQYAIVQEVNTQILKNLNNVKFVNGIFIKNIEIKFLNYFLILIFIFQLFINKKEKKLKNKLDKYILKRNK